MAGMRSTKRAKRALEKLGLIFVDADGRHYHYRASNGCKITVVLGHKEISEASTQEDLYARRCRMERLRGAILLQEHSMRSYTILIHRDADSDMFLVDVPDLPGVVTEGATEVEAIANASEAIRSHLAFLQRDGDVIPEPSYDARSVAVAV